MNATTLYVETCKRLLFIEDQTLENPSAWDENFSILPKLRQALSCRVCRGLLVDPHGSQSCQHFVCRGCLRKKRSLNPGCRWCLNLHNLKEDKQIRIVMACYRKLCEMLISSPMVQRLRSQNGEVNQTHAILLEAISTPISLDNQIQLKPYSKMHGTDNSGSGENLNPAETKVSKKVPDVGIYAKRQVLQLLKETGEDGNSSAKVQRKRKKHFKGSTYFSPKRRRTSSGRGKHDEIDSIQTNEQEMAGKEKINYEKIGVESNDLEDNVFCIENEELNNGEMKDEEDDNEKFHDCLTDTDPNYEQDNSQKKNDMKDEDVDCQEEVIVDVVEPVNGIHEDLKCSLDAEITSLEKSKGSTKYEKSKRPKKCFCGRRDLPKRSGSKRCSNVRCPCFIAGNSCKDCPCKYCGNPFNENNNISENISSGNHGLQFIHDEQTVLVS